MILEGPLEQHEHYRAGDADERREESARRSGYLLLEVRNVARVAAERHEESRDRSEHCHHRTETDCLREMSLFVLAVVPRQLPRVGTGDHENREYGTNCQFGRSGDAARIG